VSKRRDRGSELEAFTNDLTPPVRRGKGLDGMIGAAPPAPVERGDDTALSPSETDALTHCEAVIERGLKTFFEVGNALLRIRELELYRIEYRTFEAYCAERWGISRPRAYELMNASQVVSAIADKSTEPADFQLPQNEAQARPLTRLKDTAQQREAWNRAVQRAGGDRITARLVDQAVSEILAELAPARVEIIDQEVADAASPAMSPDAHGEPADDAADPDDEHDPVAHIQTELTMTRDERDRLVELSDRLFALLDSYQEQITRAQNYKPTSDRGEAVSPLLRLIEQIYLTLIESEPDDTSGGERGKHTSR
jgi:hypothetical protein